eukprot:TRINITY_DN20812_c0_g1_i1.p1 TRINITY_DN20812_c0_g1~~TRINITY_DN20812_c0_g1_i1.p1  ORF type:complete len:245 (+),score=19.85 TRINITY_DN20812_c0_g1_i1:88-735(+)
MCRTPAALGQVLPEPSCQGVLQCPPRPPRPAPRAAPISLPQLSNGDTEQQPTSDAARPWRLDTGALVDTPQYRARAVARSPRAAVCTHLSAGRGPPPRGPEAWPSPLALDAGSVQSGSVCASSTRCSPAHTCPPLDIGSAPAPATPAATATAFLAVLLVIHTLAQCFWLGPGARLAAAGICAAAAWQLTPKLQQLSFRVRRTSRGTAQGDATPFL